MTEQKLTEQSRLNSATWWLGMAMCAAQGVCGVLMAAGIMPEVTAGAVIGAFAGVLAYCNGNNPSLKGRY